jgi:hypothetical protein
MAFKKAADGVTKKGKTEGKNLGDSGPTAAAQKGKGGKGSAKGGKTDADMMSMGRGMAKVANQKRG